MTKLTLKSLSARIDAQDTKLDAILEALTQAPADADPAPTPKRKAAPKPKDKPTEAGSRAGFLAQLCVAAAGFHDLRTHTIPAWVASGRVDERLPVVAAKRRKLWDGPKGLAGRLADAGLLTEGHALADAMRDAWEDLDWAALERHALEIASEVLAGAGRKRKSVVTAASAEIAKRSNGYKALAQLEALAS
jgi:hypothetical protein